MLTDGTLEAPVDRLRIRNHAYPRALIHVHGADP
jgi:hypothetical protein